MSTAQRIPSEIDGADTVKGYDVRDLRVALAPFAVTLVFGQYIPDFIPYMYPTLVGVSLIIAPVIMWGKPNHIPADEWVRSHVKHVKQPKEIHLEVSADEMAREEPVNPEIEPGLFDVDRDTTELTSIKRIHKGANAIEREDKTIIGAVRVEPANLALASQQTWDRLANEFQQVLDNEVNYKIQIYSTTEPFPVGEYIQHFESRMSDPDVRERPILQELLADYLSWYPRYLNYQGTNSREYYVIVSVGRDEVYAMNRDEKTLIESLSEVQVIGRFIDLFVETADNKTEEEKQRDQIHALQNRLKSLETQLRELSGCDASMITATEHAVLLKEYWEGKHFDINAEMVGRELPVQRGQEPVTRDEVAQNDGYHGGATER